MISFAIFGVQRIYKMTNENDEFKITPDEFKTEDELAAQNWARTFCWMQFVEIFNRTMLLFLVFAVGYLSGMRSGSEVDPDIDAKLDKLEQQIHAQNKEKSHE